MPWIGDRHRLMYKGRYRGRDREECRDVEVVMVRLHTHRSIWWWDQSEITPTQSNQGYIWHRNMEDI